MNKVQKITTLGLLFSLASCGFGGKHADPLNGKSDTYVSESQKDKEIRAIEENFAKESAKYQQSVADNKAKVTELKAQMDANIAENLATYQKASLTSVKEFEGERDKFVAQTEAFKVQCEKIEATQNQSIANLETTIQAYEEQNRLVEAQSFEGLLHKFDIQGAKPLSLIWKSGEAAEYKLRFEFLLGPEDLIKDLIFKPELPSWIQVKRDEGDKNMWTLSGIANVQVPNGELNLSTKYTVIPDANIDAVVDEQERNHLKKEIKEREFTVVVEKSQARPEIVEVKNTVIDEDQVRISIKVKDPMDIAGDKPPHIVFSHKSSEGTDISTILDATLMITKDGKRSENPEKSGDSWTYYYVLHKNMVTDIFPNLNLSKKITLTYQVQAQSQVSGSLVEIPEAGDPISFKGDQ